MSNTDDDKDLMLLVAAGTTLVATGTALSSVRPMVGVALILVAVAFLLFSLVCSVQRQKGDAGCINTQRLVSGLSRSWSE